MNDVVGSRPEGGCTVNLINVVDEPFFNLVVQLVHSTSDEFDTIMEVQQPIEKNTKKNYYKKKRPQNLPSNQPFLLLKGLSRHSGGF